MRSRTILAIAIAALGLAGLTAAFAVRASREPRVTLVAVGDVLLARGVGKEIARRGPDYPFEKVRGEISSADIAFCNLECPLSTRGFPHRKRFLFRADPKLASGLKWAGFGVVSLANNHTEDYGRDALMDTAAALKGSDIAPSGAGRTRAQAVKPLVVERKGLKVAFLSYSDLPSDGQIPIDDRPGIARVNLDTFASEIRNAKRQADTLVVSFHWGVEYWLKPTQRQRMLAHAAIDAGADLVIGHHPHVLQPVEVYRGRPIAYSMGGFVFDPVKSLRPAAVKTAMYRFELTRGGAKLVRIIPAEIRMCRPVVSSRGKGG